MKFANKLINNFHIIFFVLLCFIPLFWFFGHGDVLITGLDTNFPLNPYIWFVRRFYVWNGINNAGVDFSSSTAGIFFHFIQVVPYLFKLPLKLVEIFSMVFWFSAIVGSSYLLSKVIIPKNKVSQIVFVVVYSLNPYLFNTWENVKVSNLSLVASLPLFIAIIYYCSKEIIDSKKALFYLCLSSILASGTGINPAYFAVIILSILIESILLGIESIKKIDGKLSLNFKIFQITGLSILILLLVNSFWIFPLFNFLFRMQKETLSDLGFTDWLQSLSQNTSIINVARLQGAWDWYALDSYGMPQYLPYTLNYLYKFPFIIFSFVVPFLSLCTFLFMKLEKKFWYLYFGTLAVLGIFFGVGSHSPTGQIFLFLSKHVPFFSFFRSPWYIFTPMLTLAYAGLTAILFERMFDFINSYKSRVILNILSGIFIFSYLLYNYPLINGKIFRPDKDGFYIHFPDYVWNTELSVNENERQGRIISYPDDQLESFNWGYKGTESILSLFSNRETVTPSFNVSSIAFSKIQNLFYSQIKRNQYSSALSLLNFLGANEIFYKNDVSTLSPGIEEQIKNFVDETKFGSWTFMNVKNSSSDKIFIPKSIYRNLGMPDDFAYVSSLLPPKTIVINNNDSEAQKIESFNSFPIITNTYNLGEQKDEVDNIQNYQVTIPKDGLFSFAIEKEFVDKNEINTSVDNINIATSLISQNDSLIKIGPLKLSKGKHVLKVVYPMAANLLDDSNFLKYSEDLKLRKEELPNDIQNTFVAFNSTNNPVTIKMAVKDFNPFLKYAIGFDYKYIYGSVPVIDTLQSAPTSPVKSDPIYPGSSMDWSHTYKIYNPVETNSKLEVFLRMPPNSPGDSSKSFFEHMFVKRIYDNKAFVIEENSDNNINMAQALTFNKKSPVRYDVNLNENEPKLNGNIIVFLESYSPGWELNLVGGSKSSFKPIHFSVDGYANAWYVPDTTESNYTIYYSPQNIFLFGIGISVATIIGALIYRFIKRND